MLGRQVKVYAGSVRSASTSPGPLPASCDVAIVGAGAAGLMTAIQARKTAHTPSGAPGRRPYARREDSGQRRVALQRHQHHRHRARLLGRQANDCPPHPARVSGERDGLVLRSEWRGAAGRRRRQAVSFDESIARRPRRAAAQRSRRLCRTAFRHSREQRRTLRGCVPDQHLARTTDRIIARPGDWRSLASEDRQRRRGLCDRACARSLHRRSDTRAGAAAAVRRRSIRDPS